MGQQSYCQAMPEQQYFIKRWALPIGIILLLGKYAQPTDPPYYSKRGTSPRPLWEGVRGRGQTANILLIGGHCQSGLYCCWASMPNRPTTKLLSGNA